MDAVLSSHCSSRFPLGSRKHSRHHLGHLPALVSGLWSGQPPAATHEGRRCCGGTGRCPDSADQPPKLQSPVSPPAVPGRPAVLLPQLQPARHTRSLQHCPRLGDAGAECGRAEVTGSPSQPLTALCDMSSPSYCTFSFQHQPAPPTLTSICLGFPSSWSTDPISSEDWLRHQFRIILA